MGVKNMFKKSSKIFDREGFYIVLFVCLCIVAVAAVYISRNNANSNKNLTGNNTTGIEQNNEKPGATMVEGDNNTVPTSTGTNNNTSTNTNTKSNTSSTSTKTTTTTTKTTTTNAVLKFGMPIDGQISISGEYVDFLNDGKVASVAGGYGVHEGIDILAEIGTEVKAVADGKIVRMDDNPVLKDDKATLYGYSVEIEHSSGLRTVYGNLDPNKLPEGLKVGSKVKKGQIIGSVGDSYYTEQTGGEVQPHLHFMVWEKAKSSKVFQPVNPAKYLTTLNAKK